MKTSKKIISMLLCIVMVLSTFAGLGFVFDGFEAKAATRPTDANGNTILGGITQQRVVGTDGSYATTYAGYQDRFFTGKESNAPTNFVIPGLGANASTGAYDDYTPQGLTYWPEKDWILISAYDASGNKKNSVIYALDASTTDFVALFNVYNADGSVNTSHGGGIAASEYNFYYADSGSKISYVPLSEMNVPDYTVKDITLRGSIDCAGELTGEDQSNAVATSYCCYEEGILWAGNFYFSGDDAYKNPWHGTYPSVLMGYKLKGNSSAEEWANLQKRNILQLGNQMSGTNDSYSDITFTLSKKDFNSEGYIDVFGTTTAGSAVGEAYTHFADNDVNSCAFKVDFVAGKSYVIEFDTNTQAINGDPQTNIYFLAGANWSNSASLFDVKSQATITQNENGSWHYRAVVKPNQTATYVGRLDQRNISTSYSFDVTDLRVYENPHIINVESATNATNGVMTYSVTENNNGYIDITTSASATGSSELKFQLGTAYLQHGQKYVLEFDLDRDFDQNDIYFLRDNNTGSFSNVKYTYTVGNEMTKTDNGNGTWHYRVEFTPGTKICSVKNDGNWGNGADATGIYTIRFDQDSYTAGQTTHFTNLKIQLADYDRNDGKDRCGNPTFVVPFNADLDRLQYAMVYKGKIYLSRSWSRTESTNHIRELCIGDFDINVPGNKSVKVNGRQRTINVVEAANVTKFGGSPNNSKKTEMLYMSEGICVINDYVYIFAESAAWNYYGKGTVCPEGIDVLWKIDQYAVMGEPRSHDDDSAVYYEKVMDKSEITRQDSYILVYESPEKDPVTQMPILYALDSYGGYGEKRLPKGPQLNADGTYSDTQKNTGMSMGIIGHPISDYSLDEANGEHNDLIYISEEDDTKKSIHWNIEGGPNDATGTPFRLVNQDEYYYNNKYLYFGSRLMLMCNETKTALNYLNFEQYGGSYSGDFRFYYRNTGADTNPAYYLWCNDGTVTKAADGTAYTTNTLDTYTAYYSNHGKTDYTPSFDGLEEQKGTFHMDAELKSSDSGNLTGKALPIDPQLIHIYKRVVDPYSSTYRSRLYTDLTAELQADGTYNITMEAYATSPVQYQTVDYDRPTDFIFVLDGSGSMTNNSDATGWSFWDKDLGIGTGASITDLSGLGASDLCESDGSNWKQNCTGAHNGYYFRTDDGTYCPIYVDARTGERSGSVFSRSWTTYIKIYYTYNGVNYYYQKNTGTFTTTETEISSGSHSSTDSRKNNLHDDDCGDGRFNIPHYKWSTSTTRLDAMKSAVTDLIYKIEDEQQRTGLNHRIAITEFGSDSAESYLNTGVYTNANTTMISYPNANTANYQNAFHNSNDNTQVMNAINIIKAMRTDIDDPDTYSQYGFEMAKKIMQNSGASYLAGGERACAVIMITDGIPGQGVNDGNKDTVSNNAITEAAAIKSDMGGYVYSVLIGDVNGAKSDYGNMEKYMNYVSTNYVDAKSLTDSGVRNISDTAYYVEIPSGTDFNLERITVDIFNSVNSNAQLVLRTCTDTSVLREQLTEAFNLNNASMTVQTATSGHDGLGRIYFNDPVAADTSLIKTELTKGTNTITSTGFDFTEEYISDTKEGRKLIITLTGVLANENSELVNTSINNTNTTAIYQTDDFSTQPVKYFPTSFFTIPEYTYVLDFEQPMRDIDINGKPLAVSATLSQQNVNNYPTTLDRENMGIEIENNDNLIYTLNEGSNGKAEESKGYILIERPDGTYDWFRINVIPASNVMFEESSMNLAKVKADVAWSSIGSAVNAVQSLATDNDVYGYDPNYSAGNDAFSNGTAITATVTSSAKKSDTASFTFKGTGVDVIGACGPDTGVQVITIRNSAGKAVKAFVVDTYYSDAAYGTLRQIPLASWRIEDSQKYEAFKDIGYDEYTVEVGAAYLSFAGALKTSAVGTATDAVADNAVDYTSADAIFAELGMDELIGVDSEIIWMDDNSIFNGGTGVEGELSTQAVTSLVNYVDGIRVYNPIDPEDVSDQQKYIESEQGATYHNIIASLAGSDDIISGNNATSFVGYVEGAADSTIAFADYFKQGVTGSVNASTLPKNEVYLTNGSTSAIAFKVALEDGARVMVSMRAASGAAKADVNGNAFDVTSATEMYYDITSYIGTDGLVTIKNTGSGLLAVDNIKFVHGVSVPMTAADLPAVAMLMTMASTDVLANSSEPVSKYPDYAPDVPAVLAPPTDEEGEITVILPSDNNATPDEPAIEVPDKVQTFVNDVKEFIVGIINWLKSLFGKLAIYKEV